MADNTQPNAPPQNTEASQFDSFPNLSDGSALAVEAQLKELIQQSRDKVEASKTDEERAPEAAESAEESTSGGSGFDSFPDYNSPEAKRVEQELLRYLIEGSSGANGNNDAEQDNDGNNNNTAS
ncbi:hypothetical protein GQ54DRAFT_294714, partial [Martensiomyces pterosporus]